MPLAIPPHQITLSIPMDQQVDVTSARSRTGLFFTPGGGVAHSKLASYVSTLPSVCFIPSRVNHETNSGRSPRKEEPCSLATAATIAFSLLPSAAD